MALFQLLKNFGNSSGKTHVDELTTRAIAEYDSNTVPSVHPYTDNPDHAWEVIKVKQKPQRLAPLPLDTPVHPDQVG